MKKILRAVLSAAVGTIGLAACDAASPPDAAISRPIESEAVVEPEAIAGPEAIAAREAIYAVLRDEDPFARAQRLGGLLPTLGPEAVPALKKALKDPTLDYGATEVELLVRAWATHQPADASRWAALKSPFTYRSAAIAASFTPWAEADPQAVVAALQQWGMQAREAHDAMQLALVRGWFAVNPSDLSQYIEGIGMGLERQRAVAIYIRAMIQTQGPEAVMRWAESLPGDDATYKTTVYRQVAAALPLFDQDAGFRWCEAHCDGPYGNNLRTVIARRWVRSDAAATLAWLSAAPEGPEKSLALMVAFDLWGREDPEAALDWMAARTTGEPEPWLRPIFPVYARLLAPESPAEAIEWAERIENEKGREVVLIRVARAWRQADEAAAEAWLLQSSLSEEAREKVRAPEPQRRPSG